MSPENIPYPGHDLEALADLPNYHAWLIDGFRPYLNGSTLEIGAGIGTISRRIAPLVDHFEVIEPSRNLHSRLAATLAGSNARIHHDPLEACLGRFGSASWDSVVMVNVLEHIADDAQTMSELNRILRPGGHLLLFVPALPALFAPIDDILGHYRRYRLEPLAAIAEAAGFTLVEDRTRHLRLEICDCRLSH